MLGAIEIKIKKCMLLDAKIQMYLCKILYGNDREYIYIYTFNIHLSIHICILYIYIYIYIYILYIYDLYIYNRIFIYIYIYIYICMYTIYPRRGYGTCRGDEA